MSGTIEGGRKARDLNIEKYGHDFYKKIGSKGGSVKRPETRFFRMYPNEAREAGIIGGRKSRRNK